MPIYVVAGSFLEYQRFLAAQYLTIHRLDTVWVGGVRALVDSREPEVIVTGAFRARSDWPEIEAELRARKATVRYYPA
jgi:hypothetical protein